MAACGQCKKQISAADSKKQHVEYKNGRVNEVLHAKCYHLRKRRAWVGDPSGKYYADSPDAYKVATTVKNADDLTPEAKAHQERVEAEWKKFRQGQAADPALLDDVLEYQVWQKRKEDLAKDREKEEAPKGFSDWREPDSMEI